MKKYHEEGYPPNHGLIYQLNWVKMQRTFFFALITPIWSGRRVLFPIPTITKADFLFLKKLVDKGVFKPIIDRLFNLDQIVDACKYVDSGQKTGNVVLKIGE